jgi:hypothetical protein
MKVTAILPDNLISEVKHLSKGKNITDSLVIALNEWVNLKNISKLNSHIKKHPLQFQSNYTAEKIREINRIR